MRERNGERLDKSNIGERKVGARLTVGSDGSEGGRWRGGGAGEEGETGEKGRNEREVEISASSTNRAKEETRRTG